MGFEVAWWIYLPGCEYSIVTQTAIARGMLGQMNCLNDSYYGWQVLTRFLRDFSACIHVCTSISVVVFFLQLVALSASVCTQFLQTFNRLSPPSIFIFWGESLWKKATCSRPCVCCMFHCVIIPLLTTNLFMRQVISQMVWSRLIWEGC